jgi:ferredoxin-type protein NapF
MPVAAASSAVDRAPRRKSGRPGHWLNPFLRIAVPVATTCIDACPEQIIVIGDGGYPTIDFKRGECTFCADCVSACKPLALVRGEDQPGWTHKAVIADSCLPHRGVECRVCEDFCDARAIRFSPRLGGSPLPVIAAEKCTGCGACLAPCPVNAISIAV